MASWMHSLHANRPINAIGFWIFCIYRSFSNKHHIDTNGKAINTLTARVDANTKLHRTQAKLMEQMSWAVMESSLAPDNLGIILLRFTHLKAFLSCVNDRSQEFKLSIRIKTPASSTPFRPGEDLRNGQEWGIQEGTLHHNPTHDPALMWSWDTEKLSSSSSFLFSPKVPSPWASLEPPLPIC